MSLLSRYSIPPFMQAAFYGEHGGPENLLVGEIPTPEARPGEALVKIEAAALGAWDLGVMRSGFGNPSLPHVPSTEIAGVVQTAPDSARFEPGDEVYAALGFASGGLAEYAAVAADQLQLKPSELSFVEAAALVVPAGTAYEGLVDRADLQGGETVLITAASGNVGVAVVQVAAAVGATPLAVASYVHHEYLRELGAAETFDYHDPDWPSRVRAGFPGGVDVLFDSAGGDTRQHAADLVRVGGRAVFIIGPPDPLRSDIKAHIFTANITQERLGAISRLVSEGKLKAHVAKQLPLAEARQAMTLLADENTRGRVVVTLA